MHHSIKRITLLTLAAALCALCLAPPVSAQPAPTSSVTIKMTNAPTARFKVDGREYKNSATFLWPIGSKHVLDFPRENDGFQYNNAGQTRHLFGNWSDNAGGVARGADQVISVDPSIHTISGTASTDHLISVILFDGLPVAQTNTDAQCGNPGRPPSGVTRPGVVAAGSICYWSNFQYWAAQDGLNSISAFAYPGFIFLGWSANSANNATSPTFTVKAPMVVHARFTSAKRVSVRTEPSGLNARVDRTVVRTPEIEPCEPNDFAAPFPPPGIKPLCHGDFDFAPGSKHIIGAVSPQLDKVGRAWIFDGFSSGQGQDFIYTTPAEIYPEERFVARFVRGVHTSFLSKPAGLKIAVDGRDNWAENYFIFAPGTKHTIGAPVEQTDARGRKYRFKRWTNGGAANQEVTIPQDAVESGYHLVAEYELLSQITIRSNPAGSPVLIDGVECATPCKVDRPDGTEVRVAAPENTSLSEVHRLQFTSWSNGGGREQSVRVGGVEPGALTANFQTAFRLVLAADPPEGASLTVSEPSPDNFYPANTIISLNAEERQGYRFRRWDFDVSGTSRTVTFSMSGPRTALARLDKVPFIPPAGIRNAAAPTADGTVAPGSLISISGGDLAGYYEAGPAGPILAQVLAGVSVTVGNRILPLLFVSPEQINAQLPRDLAPGEHTLRVLRAGYADIVGKFTVAPTAPGLFNQRQDEQSFAVARHEDGTPVTIESPARRGETISLTGTGFGVYQIPHPEGFALPPGPGFRLAAENVSVLAGELQFSVSFAGGAAGQVGIDVVQFKVPEESPVAPGNLQLKVRVDGRETNAVILPLQ